MNYRYLRHSILALLVTLATGMAAQDDVLFKADPFWGTNNGNVVPGAAVPWGMVKLSPDVVLPDTPTSGYRDDSPIAGFSHTHANGVGGAPRYGNIMIIPQCDSLTLNGYLPFAKQNEQAYPGYYTVLLRHANNAVKTELTATERVGYHRYTFRKDYNKTHEVCPYVLVDVAHVNRRIKRGRPQTYCERGHISLTSDRTLEGWAYCVGGWGGDNPYTIYFAIEFDAPFHQASIFADGRQLDALKSYDYLRPADGDGRFGAALAFDTLQLEIGCRVAISYQSTDMARRHLEAERKLTFDDALNRATAAWTDRLGRIRVKGGTVAAQRMLYSAMRSTMMMPTRLSEPTPDWKRPHFTDFYCIWDTYRTISPLYTLIHPDVQRDIINCLLDIYQRRGYMPDAWIGSDYATVQGGSNADVVMADAVVKKLGGFDRHLALEAAVKDAEVQSATPDHCGRYVDDYRRYGYLRSETVKNSVSRSLEYAYNDYCIAQMALSCGEPLRYADYARRSLSVYNLFHTEHRMFWGKDSLGHWKPGFSTMPTRQDSWNDPYFYEGGAMIYSTYVPHDMAGLISRHGGPAAFRAFLDQIFDKGVFNIENEFEFLVPYLYLYTGDYASTARRLHRILNSRFTLGRNGVPGQDDAGAISAWYVFSAMGFFPVAGQDIYLLGTPSFDEVEVTLEHDRKFRVKAVGRSEKNIYITSATLNGQPLRTSWFRHTDISNGGELVLQMGSEPSDFGTAQVPPSLSTDFFVSTLTAEQAEVLADSLVGQMTTNEKIAMISGHNSFFIKGLPRLSIPELYMSDATAGVHIRRELSNAMTRSVAFPAPVALAATWNPTLAYNMAHAIGEECRAGGISILLGPGLNIYRVSQNGRNFEYFGEDPCLASRITEGYVVGMQSTGTMATLKHFVCNNNEHHRRLSNALVGRRALNEIYLPAFKAGIDAGAAAVMTSYNMVNGEYTAESRSLVTDVLRRQLGFGGLVMSDWRSVYNAQKTIRSGLDLEMPGDYAEWLQALGDNPFRHLKHEAPGLLRQGDISEADIDRMVHSIIRSSAAMGFYDRPLQDTTLLQNFANHEQVALQVGRESIVLLKNEGSLLPLSPNATDTILLTGIFTDTIPVGGGSAAVEGYNNVTMHQALTSIYGQRLRIVQKPSDDDLRRADVVIVSVGSFDREGIDRAFAMPDSIEALAQRATMLNNRTVVVVNSGGGVKMTNWNDRAAAIVYAWYPGQAGNTALAEIISGQVSPSGRLPFTIEREFADTPGCNYKPADEAFDMPWQDEYSFRFPVNNIDYNEGIFVGYRWFDKKYIKPLFPFGHGLSYTTFHYSNISMPSTFRHGENVDVRFTVQNTGNRAADEVVQLYVQDNHASVARPVKELKAFRRVSLQPGQTKTVTLTLKPDDFAYFDEKSDAWRTEPGTFTIYIGASSNDIRLSSRTKLLKK